MQGQTLGLKQLVNRKAPHSLGLETWLLGLQATHRLGGDGCQLLCGGGTPLIAPRGQQGRPEPEAQYMLGSLPPLPGRAGGHSPFTAHFPVSAWWSGTPRPRPPRWAPFLQQPAGLLCSSPSSCGDPAVGPWTQAVPKGTQFKKFWLQSPVSYLAWRAGLGWGRGWRGSRPAPGNSLCQPGSPAVRAPHLWLT